MLFNSTLLEYFMPEKRISLKRTVYYDEDSGAVCQCAGDFYKTCSLRAAHQLPCREAILSITPIERDEDAGLAPDAIRSIHKDIARLKHELRAIDAKVKI